MGLPTNSGGQSNLPPPSSVAYEQMVWAQGVRVTDIAPAQLLEQAAAHMIGRGFVIESRQETSLNLMFHEEANARLGCFLLFLGLLPGILYLIFGGGDHRMTLFAVDEAGGSRVYVSGDIGAPLDELRNWVLSLPGSVVPH